MFFFSPDYLLLVFIPLFLGLAVIVISVAFGYMMMTVTGIPLALAIPITWGLMVLAGMIGIGVAKIGGEGKNPWVK